MEDYKVETRNFYSKKMKSVNRVKDAKYFAMTDRFLYLQRAAFLEALAGKHILDVGSGPARDGTYFMENGFSPVCIDLVPEAARFCRKEGLPSCVMDIEHLGFRDESFDGVWACASLDHFPSEVLPSVLTEISRVMKDKGVLLTNVREGTYEGPSSGNMFDGGHWVTLYQDSNFRAALSKEFEILNFWNISSPSKELVYLCRKKAV